MAAGHSHGQGGGHSHGAGGNERSLTVVLALTTTFLVVEFVGGVLTQSLALISDAAHMLTDTAALAIALAAITVQCELTPCHQTDEEHHFTSASAAAAHDHSRH